GSSYQKYSISPEQLAAGGGQKCNPVSQIAFTSLLAAGKNCDQQDAADQMIDLAKQLNNDAEMIRLAQLFVQQPRNAVRRLLYLYPSYGPRPDRDLAFSSPAVFFR